MARWYHVVETPIPDPRAHVTSWFKTRGCLTFGISWAGFNGITNQKTLLQVSYNNMLFITIKSKIFTIVYPTFKMCMKYCPSLTYTNSKKLPMVCQLALPREQILLHKVQALETQVIGPTTAWILEARPIAFLILGTFLLISAKIISLKKKKTLVLPVADIDNSIDMVTINDII